MDDPAIDPGEHERALRGLARLNRLSGIDRTVWRELRRIAGGRPLRVLDIAAGSGDLAISLARRAGRTDVPFEFSACDLSELAVERTRHRAADAGAEVGAFRLDALRDQLPEDHDVVMCHLFLHHLDGPDIADLLARMHAAARRAVLITDLERTRVAYALAFLASRLVTRSPVVRTDALLSVRAALTPGELRSLAHEAGFTSPRIRRVIPARMILTCPA
jgi:2-polyprenyl-3-methyl-5-hydroxy-6-metoxy-1,4-benzoquinol methylase